MAYRRNGPVLSSNEKAFIIKVGRVTQKLMRRPPACIACIAGSSRPPPPTAAPPTPHPPTPQALQEGQRIDGRRPTDLRPARFSFALDGSSCTVLLGSTRVMTTITASLEAPYPDRPNEGSLRFNVEFLPMAAPHFESGRPGEEATEVARLVERGLRESRAIDQEALVVLAGRKVWHLRADVFVQVGAARAGAGGGSA